MTNYNNLQNEVNNVSGLTWDIAEKVWGFAELGMQEYKSSALQRETLENDGFTISHQGVAGLETAWVASYGSGSPEIGLLIEFDALPDLGNATTPHKQAAASGNSNGHGCGHNLIGAGTVGAAIALKNHMQKEGIPGTIRVFACPAEELLAGKNYMAKAGVFDDLDVCIHHHPGPVTVPFNFRSTASMDLEIEFKGVTAHAGASPWDGRSALQAAQLFTHGVDMMREHIIPSARMHYIIENGGTAVNVVPDYAKVVFRYRGPNAENVKKHISWIKDIAQGAALATQTQESILVLAGCYDLLPNDVLAERMSQHLNNHFPIQWSDDEQAFAKVIQTEIGVPADGMATAVLPKECTIEMGGSSDVGDVSWIIPTIGAMFSSWPQHVSAHQWGCTATNGMDIGKKGVIQASQVMAAMALDLLTSPELIEQATDEFMNRTGGKPYISLCEKDTYPIR
jgi:aminobenzoyl-glutamate utilization protein B